MLEDEGHMIGANHLPESLRLRMAQCRWRWWKIRLTFASNGCAKSIRSHVSRLYRRVWQEKGWQAYGEYLHHGLFAIRRRPGCSAFAQLTERLDEALVQQRTASTEAHFARAGTAAGRILRPDVSLSVGEKAEILSRSWQEVAAWLAK